MQFFIGPCVLESEGMAVDIASKLKEDLKSFDKKMSLTFKASYDKANRTSINSFRGLGINEGLKILSKVKKETGLTLVTDFHLPEQANEIASVVDFLQVPAFLCRQTDMLIAAGEAAAKYKKVVKVKKGQFLAPWDVENIITKLTSFIPKDQILLTERGASFGYNNLIVDMSSFKIMKSFGVKTIHDATHCVQMPGGLGTATGGKRDQIEVLAQAAVAAGCDGIFMETHPEPAKAKSDASTALPLTQIKRIVGNLLAIREAYKGLDHGF
jgi:2-dehydro-3-deoxyphosphooctonate aldolase (KDO 8-P synthase)